MKYLLTLILSLTLASAWASETASPFVADAPLPFDEPSAAPPLKKPQKSGRAARAKQSTKVRQVAKSSVKRGKAVAKAPRKTVAKAKSGGAKKIAPAKSTVKKRR